MIPIVAIHGGPGWPHNYMLPLQQQACRGRPVYFYDQAGCGESALPPQVNNTSVADEYPWLLTAEYYATEELPTLIDHWGLEKYHIIGNSWGTILSQLFALDTEATGLQSMVLSGPLSEAKLYIDSQWSQSDGSLGSLPPFVQERIHWLESQDAYDSVEYQAIASVLTTKFTCRTAPLPDCFLDSSTKANEEIYVGMQGPSEFIISGTLGTLNITHRLADITCPVLLTHGQYDTMRPAVVKAMFEQLPLAETILLSKSAHVSMIDEPQLMNDAIAEFFDRVESPKPFVARPSKEFSSSYGAQTTAATKVWLPWQHLPSVLVALTTLVLAFGLGATVGRNREMHRRRENYDSLP